MQVDFYHLTRHPLDRVLPRLAERVVEGGGRLLIVEQDAARRALLDTALWTYAPDSFLPHGVARGAGTDGEGAAWDARQPILIAATPAPANAARHIAFADGIWRDAALEYDRVFHLFDEERIAEARAAWKMLADRAEIERRYWKQNAAGRWEQAA